MFVDASWCGGWGPSPSAYSQSSGGGRYGPYRVSRRGRRHGHVVCGGCAGDLLGLQRGEVVDGYAHSDAMRERDHGMVSGRGVCCGLGLCAAVALHKVHNEHESEHPDDRQRHGETDDGGFRFVSVVAVTRLVMLDIAFVEQFLEKPLLVLPPGRLECVKEGATTTPHHTQCGADFIQAGGRAEGEAGVVLGLEAVDPVLICAAGMGPPCQVELRILPRLVA
mmetsp:Transcript_18985/g.45469  ORF Transcript_18985/g.45469 Transcript_18985/m.45469 type:complete len:222 (+) Transcript_18985:61-726(+)